MNYAQAKVLVAEHAPDLILDAEVPGQKHITVRKSKDGAPFSIMLPIATEASPISPEDEQKMVLDSLAAASTHLVG